MFMNKTACFEIPSTLQIKKEGKDRTLKTRLFVVFLMVFILFLGLSVVRGKDRSDHHILHENYINRLTFQENVHLKGTVVDAKTGEPLVGVTIKVKGKNKGTVSGAGGKFDLQVADDATLVVSYVSYETKEVPVNGRNEIAIKLSTSAKQLNELVVTALGVKKEEAALSYSTQQVSGDDLTKVKTGNMVDALSGKVAGMSLSPSAGGLGSSAKVILRGARSANGNNQPLYVVDGVPISNGGNGKGQQNSLFGGTPEGGDGIENLNPDDIASISVLKGASAAALYGSQAQNGVILITTKQGKKGKTSIHFSSDFSMKKIAYSPKFQNGYGQTNKGSTFSWGDPLSKHYDNVDPFFRTGTNWTNSISLSAGTDKTKTYFSYANTAAKGIQPNNKLQKNNFFLHETGKFLNDKLTVDGSVTYVNQKINNNPAIGYYLNPLVSLYLFPRGQNILPYKKQYEFPEKKGVARQNWFVSGDDMRQQNPWWVANRDLTKTTRNRVILNGTLKYQFNDWLNLQVKGNLDRAVDDYVEQRYAGTDVLFNENGHGFMGQNKQTITQKYGEAILNVAAPNPDATVQVSGLVGTSIKDVVSDQTNVEGDLSTPDFFSVSNIISAYPSTSVSVGALDPTYTHTQLQSVFANVDVSYDQWLFLTLTGRNDWSSNLSYTPNVSFFYPSAGLSVILSRILDLPQFVSYGKVRGSWAQVGNTVPPYLTKVQNTQSGAGQLNFNTEQSFRTLKPEKTNSLELGTDWNFLNNRLHFSFTYYKTNTKNQYVPVIPPVASLVSKGYVNAGNIQNEGIEFTVGADIIKQNHLSWTTTINGSSNHSDIIDVDSKDGIDRFMLTDGGNAYQSRIQKGGSYGDIYGSVFKRDEKGRIIFSGSGTKTDPYIPQTQDEYGYIGNPNPKFQIGWGNTLTYKNFNLYFLFSGRFGGQVLSMTQMVLDLYGVSERTGDARDAGSVAVNGVDEDGNAVSEVDPKSWYSTTGGRQGISESGIFNASVARLREVSLGYTFPVENSVIEDLSLAITGRNLFYIYKKAPFDPELTMSTGNGMDGVDLFTQPATRNFGIKLNVTF